MNFLFRALLVILLLLGLQYLFLRIISRAFKTTFPKMDVSVFRKIRLLIVIILNIYPVFTLIFFSVASGKPFPESTLLDYLLVFPFWTYVLIFIQTLIFVFVLKIVKLLLLPWYRRNKEKNFRTEQIIISLLFLFSVLYVPLRAAYDYYNVQIRNVVYYKKNLAVPLKTFKLVFISDTQADRYTNYKRLGNYVSLVNQQNPDLVLIGGDVITMGPDYIDSAANMLGKIKSKYGVYTCLGDHDHWAYRDDTRRSISEVTAALAGHGVPMINNKNIDININGADIGITFITNTYVERTSVPELQKLITSEHKDLKVLLTHQPGRNIIDLCAARNYDLLLAGHTHGGQITFLFPFINITPTMLETRFIKGDFYFGDMLMIITRGLGMSLVPMRINSTPEITVITFKEK